MSEKDALVVALKATVEQQRATIATMRPMYTIGHDLCVRMEFDGDTLTFVFNGERHPISRGLDKWQMQYHVENPTFLLKTASLDIQIVLFPKKISIHRSNGITTDFPFSLSQTEMLMDQFMHVAQAWNAIPLALTPNPWRAVPHD